MSKIFVVGFPKSGTSSIQTALVEAGIKSIHFIQKNVKKPAFVGLLIKKAKNEGLPLLHYLSEFDAFTQMDVSFNNCYWPQLLDVPLLDEQYPNSKFIFNTRPIHKWISSITRWGNLRVRLGRSDIPGLPPGTGYSDRELICWHDWHKNNMINYFNNKENKFIIFDIENDNPQNLGDFLGIKNIVWLHENENKRKRK